MKTAITELRVLIRKFLIEHSKPVKRVPLRDLKRNDFCVVYLPTRQINGPKFVSPEPSGPIDNSNIGYRKETTVSIVSVNPEELSLNTVELGKVYIFALDNDVYFNVLTEGKLQTFFKGFRI